MRTSILIGVTCACISFSPLALFSNNNPNNNQQPKMKTTMPDKETKVCNEANDKEISKRIPDFQHYSPWAKKGVRGGNPENLESLPNSMTRRKGQWRKGVRQKMPEKEKIEFHLKKHFFPNGRPFWILDQNGKRIAAELFLAEYEDNVNLSFEGKPQIMTFGVISICGAENIVSWMMPLPSDIDSVAFVKNGENLYLLRVMPPNELVIYSALKSEVKREANSSERTPSPIFLEELVARNYAAAHLFCLDDSFRRIRLLEFFSFDFFGGRGNFRGKVRCKNVLVENGIFRIEIENPDRGNIGQLWVDMDKAEIVKIEETLHPALIW